MLSGTFVVSRYSLTEFSNPTWKYTNEETEDTGALAYNLAQLLHDTVVPQKYKGKILRMMRNFEGQFGIMVQESAYPGLGFRIDTWD